MLQDLREWLLQGGRRLTGSRFPLPVLILGIGAAVFGDVIINAVLLLPYGPWGNLGVLALVGLALMGAGWFLVAPSLSQLFSREARRDAHLQGKPAGPARWLVVGASVGRARASVLTSVDHHRELPASALERVFILHTTDERGAESWRWLEERLQRRGLSEDQLRPVRIPRRFVDDPGHLFDRIHEIYLEAEQQGVEEDQIILDYTGGTSAFTAAMTLAGATPRRRLEYVRALRYDAAGRPVVAEGFEVIEVALDFWIRPTPEQAPLVGDERVDG